MNFDFGKYKHFIIIGAVFVVLVVVSNLGLI